VSRRAFIVAAATIFVAPLAAAAPQAGKALRIGVLGVI
jgi:hypothetical protein